MTHQAPRMTQDLAALVVLIQSYINGLMDPMINLLEVHKLIFFLQEAGEPLRLNYEKATYGTYADNLRHVFNRLEGHYITGYQDGGDAPDKQIDLVSGAVQKAKEALKDSPQTQQRMKRVKPSYLLFTGSPKTNMPKILIRSSSKFTPGMNANKHSHPNRSALLTRC